MTDLSMVPSFLLNQSGNLVANESKSSEDEKSKYSESELNSLIPIGRRYGVRCSHVHTRVHMQLRRVHTQAPRHATHDLRTRATRSDGSVPASQVIVNKPFDLRKLDSKHVQLVSHIVVMHPKYFKRMDQLRTSSRRPTSLSTRASVGRTSTMRRSFSRSTFRTRTCGCRRSLRRT